MLGLVSGCGGDDDDKAAAGASGSAGSAGSAGSSGTAGTGGTAGSGDTCVGGVIINGVCEAKCSPDKCVAGNTCVDNKCQLKCTAHTDCLVGQDCTPAKEDDTNADIAVCVWSGKASLGTPCPNKTECAGLGTCADGRGCDYGQCGGATCTLDAATCGDDPTCSRGTCPDGSACTVPACPQDQCAALVCNTVGIGDLTAYCTSADCKTDTDCNEGFTCRAVHDPHEICNSNPTVGNNSFCGTTTEACVDPADFNANGASYVEGPICLMRNRCVKRSVCATCETDLDCSENPGMVCAQAGADKRCANACAKDADCGVEFKCNNGACLPQYEGGTCVGTGKFCEPCLTDIDCGASASSTMACTTVGERGERVCFDAGFSTSCQVDADCPTSPSGKHGTCLNASQGYSASDSVFERCYLPLNSATNEAHCW